MKELKESKYFKIGITIFAVIAASIMLYFAFLRIDKLASVFYRLLEILSPVMLGIVFAYLLNPLVKFFENNVFTSKQDRRSKTSRMLSIIVTYVIVITVIIVVFVFVVPSLINSITTMLKNIPIYINNISSLMSNYINTSSNATKAVNQVNSDITTFITDYITPHLNGILTSVTTGITSFITGLLNACIGLIISVYLLYDKEEFIRGTKKIFSLILSEKNYNSLMSTFKYIHKVFGGFMIAKIIDSIIIGIITFVLLAILQIPYAPVLALIVGITNIIPYFGPFIGGGISALLLVLINPSKCLIFLVVVLIVQQFDGNILGPKIIGNKTGLKSFWVLFAILLFGGIFGFMGMLFGVPIFAVIYSLIRDKLEELSKEKKLENKTS